MDRTPVHVLVVDDDEVDREIARRALGAGYHVTEAESGAEVLQKAAVNPPSCVLVDYNIPGTNTLDLLSDLARLELPAVMLTGQGDESVAVEAMKRGAQDYLAKNDYSPEQLRSAVDVAIATIDRRRRIEDSRRRLAEQYKAEKDKRQVMETEMNVARDIQHNFVPLRPPQIAGLDVADLYLPAEATSGDFYAYLTLAGGRPAIAVGDVSGHGLGPALLAAQGRAYVRALAQAHGDVGEILAAANRLFCEDCRRGGFTTLFLAAIDPAAKLLRYAAAGHCSLLVRDTGETIRLRSDSPPLGLFPDSVKSTSHEAVLQPGDVLLLSTDGLAETRNARGELLGEERCVEIICRHRTAPAARIVGQLHQAARQFADGQAQQDDITIVAVKVL